MRLSDYQRASTTVAPVNAHSNPSYQQQASNTVQMQSDSLWDLDSIEFQPVESDKIKIVAQPRGQFRPRTQTESQDASHYIRCALNSSYEYPAILVSRSARSSMMKTASLLQIPKRWAQWSNENIIEVTLVKTNHQPHRYAISNKTAKEVYQPDAMIFRQNEPHTLYYRVTDNDFTQGYKK